MGVNALLAASFGGVGLLFIPGAGVAGTNSFRQPFSVRQTSAGPFDHGFFFDSGTAPHGGDSPYLH